MAMDFSSGKKPLAVFSLAGLTDIVLLLLIFFLLTSSFVTQYAIQVSLPQAETGAPQEQQFVDVTVTDVGEYYVNGTLTPEANLAEAISAVRGDLNALVLRADRNATVGQFATVASIARSLDMRILMATERLVE